MSELYDITIVGGGPAGLYGAFYSGMRDMKTKIIEGNEELGGVLRTFPEKMIWDVGGVTPIRGDAFIQNMIEQGMTFQPTIVLGQIIADMQRLDDGTIRLTAETGEQHLTRTVLLAIGYGVPKPVKLEVEGAERYEVSNLFYTVTDVERFRNKRVLLSGGGDTAVDWANELEAIAREVTVVHRRNQFGGHEQLVKQMKESSVNVHTPFTISSLHANARGDKVEAVTLSRVDEHGEASAEQKRLAVDAIIVNHGTKGSWGGIAHWGLERGERGMKTDETMKTNIPGVFLAGDVANYPTKITLIATAYADAVMAVNQAKLYIEPSANSRAGVSSHSDIFYEKNKAFRN